TGGGLRGTAGRCVGAWCGAAIHGWRAGGGGDGVRGRRQSGLGFRRRQLEDAVDGDDHLLQRVGESLVGRIECRAQWIGWARLKKLETKAPREFLRPVLGRNIDQANEKNPPLVA